MLGDFARHAFCEAHYRVAVEQIGIDLRVRSKGQAVHARPDRRHPRLILRTQRVHRLDQLGPLDRPVDHLVAAETRREAAQVVGKATVDGLVVLTLLRRIRGAVLGQVSIALVTGVSSVMFTA